MYLKFEIESFKLYRFYLGKAIKINKEVLQMWKTKFKKSVLVHRVGICSKTKISHEFFFNSNVFQITWIKVT